MKKLIHAIQGFFLSEGGQLTFAAVFIVLVPGFIVLNTVLSLQSARRNMDIELQRKALLAEQAFEPVVRETVADQTRLQQAVDSVVEQGDEVWGVEVLVPNGEQFRIVASAVHESVGRDISDLNAVIAWHENQAVAYQVVSSDRATVGQQLQPGDKNQRFWVVIRPFADSNNQKFGLVSMKFSSKIADDLVRASVTRSSILLGFTIVVVVLLLALNSKLFQYTVLFRKLKEVDQMKDEFISVASHELRTPITAIRGYLEMALDGSLGPMSEKAKSSLGMVEKSAARLNDLVEDLLNVSRIEQNRIDLELEDVDAHPVIAEVLAELKPMSAEKGLKTGYQGPETLPMIRVNRDRLKQVLVNLVGNGIKYTPRGSVVVSVDEGNGRLKLRVADTGIGMSPSDMARLFTKFYRIQNDQTSKIAGTGLGLWITKQIVEKMGGTIEVESIEGVGTQFVVTFPVRKSAATKTVSDG